MGDCCSKKKIEIVEKKEVMIQQQVKQPKLKNVTKDKEKKSETQITSVQTAPAASFDEMAKQAIQKRSKSKVIKESPAILARVLLVELKKDSLIIIRQDFSKAKF